MPRDKQPAEAEEELKKVTVYFREKEKAEYEHVKRVAQTYDFTISDFFKLAVRDPPKAARFLAIYLKDGYGGSDTYIKVSGGVPNRDRISQEALDMSCDELLEALRYEKWRHEDSSLRFEVYHEIYKEKMRNGHGVIVDDVQM